MQRWVTRRGTVIMTETQSLTVDYRTTAWGEAPYNGATTFRPDFDSWLADHAVDAGAVLVTSTTATGLLRDAAGRIVGVRTDRPDGDLTASARHRLRRGQLVPGQGSRAVPRRGRRELHARRQGGAGAAAGGDREALRPDRQRGRRLRDRRLHAGHRRRRVRLHEPRERRRRRRAQRDRAGRGQGAARGAHRRPQAPPDGGAARSRAPISRSTRPTSSPRAATT